MADTRYQRVDQQLLPQQQLQSLPQQTYYMQAVPTPLPTHAYNPELRNFQSDVCDCCQDLEVAATVAFLWCGCSQSMYARAYDDAGVLDYNDTLMKFCGLTVLQGVAQGLNGLTSGAGGVSCGVNILGVLFFGGNRTKLRQKYGIVNKNKGCESCCLCCAAGCCCGMKTDSPERQAFQDRCLAWWCDPLIVCQEVREIRKMQQLGQLQGPFNAAQQQNVYAAPVAPAMGYAAPAAPMAQPTYTEPTYTAYAAPPAEPQYMPPQPNAPPAEPQYMPPQPNYAPPAPKKA